MTGLGSQQWSEPELHEFPLPSEIVPLTLINECEHEGCTVPGFNFINSQGLSYEAREVNHCIREGLIETPLFSSAECVETMRLISDIRLYANKT